MAMTTLNYSAVLEQLELALADLDQLETEQKLGMYKLAFQMLESGIDALEQKSIMDRTRSMHLESFLVGNCAIGKPAMDLLAAVFAGLTDHMDAGWGGTVLPGNFWESLGTEKAKELISAISLVPVDRLEQEKPQVTAFGLLAYLANTLSKLQTQQQEVVQGVEVPVFMWLNSKPKSSE